MDWEFAGLLLAQGQAGGAGVLPVLQGRWERGWG